MRKLVLAALAASAMTAPAFAQDATFTGPRVEALVGYDSASDGTDGDAGSSDGVTYGGAIGYDVQLGGAVIGAEAELTGSSVDTRADSLLVAGDRLVVDMGRDIYLGARVGIGALVLITSVGPRPGCCSHGKYTMPTGVTSGRGSSIRISLMTPTMFMNCVCGVIFVMSFGSLGRYSRRPTASWSGQNLRANRSSMTTASGAFCVSCGPMKRPPTSVTCMASK